MTIDEIDAQLTLLNSTLEKLYQGKVVKRLEYMDDGIRRVYEYNEITTDFLLEKVRSLTLLRASLVPVKIPYVPSTVELKVVRKV